jgi:hypothetical protein
MTLRPARDEGDGWILGKPVVHLGGEARTKVTHRHVNSAIDILGSDRLHELRETLLSHAVGSIPW